MKIVICPDSFKGSLSALEVTRTIERCLKSALKDIETVTFPLADGGEGSATLLMGNRYYQKITTEVTDPLGRKIKASYLMDSTGKKAFIESAAALGLALLTEKDRNPMVASSKGLGELILDAMRRGSREISVALGGSAVCDGGMGMLNELGYKFFSATGEELSGNGRDLSEIDRIEKSSKVRPIYDIRFNTICDVVNPLYGENGAAVIFAPQKGASPTDVKVLDEGLKNMAEVSIREGIAKKTDAFRPGAGAAGGLGFAFFTFLNAKYERGIDFMLDSLDFDSRIEGADLIITGEGKIDRQSLMGKVTYGVLKRANNRNIPVIVLAGKVEEREMLCKAGFKEIYEISNPQLSLYENMTPAATRKNLEACIMKHITYGKWLNK